MLAAAGVALAGGFALEASRGSEAPLVIAGALAAVACWRAGRLRAALALGAACALLRVEAWPFLRAAGVVAWRRDAGVRPLLAALALLVPAAWFVPEWLGSGDVLRSGARARVPNPGQPALADVPALASLWAAAKLLLIPLWIGVVLALRDRRARLARGGRRRVGAARRGDGRGRLQRRAPLRAAGRGAARDRRRGRARARRARTRRARGGRSLWLAAAVPAVVELRDVRDAQAHQWALARDLGDAVAAAGGREAVLACGRPYVGRYRGPLMAYALEVTKRTVEPDLAPRAPGVVFRARLTTASAPGSRGRPAVPRGRARGGVGGAAQLLLELGCPNMLARPCGSRSSSSSCSPSPAPARTPPSAAATSSPD